MKDFFEKVNFEYSADDKKIIWIQTVRHSDTVPERIF